MVEAVPVPPKRGAQILVVVPSFTDLVKELNNPTSYVGQLNRSKEFMEGYEASRRGVTRKRNPYNTPSTEFDEWHAGWTTKFHGEQL